MLFADALVQRVAGECECDSGARVAHVRERSPVAVYPCFEMEWIGEEGVE